MLFREARELEWGKYIGKAAEGNSPCAMLGRKDPATVAMFNLAASDEFDCRKYLDDYSEAVDSLADPIEHFIRHGQQAGFVFQPPRATAPRRSVNPGQIAVPGKRVKGRGCAAIILLTGNLELLARQRLSLLDQSAPPAEIIYVVPEYLREDIRKTLGRSRICVVDGAWHMDQLWLPPGVGVDYLAFMDSSTIPGKYWLENALDACDSYDAVIVGDGYAYDRLGDCLRPLPNRVRMEDGFGSWLPHPDSYCECGTGPWVAKREWMADISTLRLERFDSGAVVLFSPTARASVNFITPFQPPEEPGLYANILAESFERLPISEIHCGSGTCGAPANWRRIHIFADASDHATCQRTLLSIKAQMHSNFICWLHGINARKYTVLAEQLELGETNFRLCSGKFVDFSMFRSADGLVALGPGEWLAHSQVLGQISQAMSQTGTLAVLCHLIHTDDVEARSFSRYRLMVNEQSAKIQNDDQTSVWILQLRHIMRQINAIAISMAALPVFSSGGGVAGIEFARLADILYLEMARKKEPLPIESLFQSGVVAWLPEPPLVSCSDSMPVGIKAVEEELLDRTELAGVLEHLGYRFHSLREMLVPQGPKGQGSAVVTIASPDYLADGFLCLASFSANITCSCDKWLYVTTWNHEHQEILRKLFHGTSYNLLFPDAMIWQGERAKALENKYGIETNEYRWGMKGPLILELMRRGYDAVQFLDPDIYTVANVDDLVANMRQHALCLYPHFRNPDVEKTRISLYTDGFFNGGMISATRRGIPSIEKFYRRCMNEIVREPNRFLFGVQRYLDFFVFESDDLFVNKDRGLDYNPWNEDPVEGFVAPSQRSFLLKSGNFGRMFHMSAGSLHAAIIRKEPRFTRWRPIVGLYMVTTLYLMELLELAARRRIPGVTSEELQLVERHKFLVQQIRRLSVSSYTAPAACAGAAEAGKDWQTGMENWR